MSYADRPWLARYAGGQPHDITPDFPDALSMFRAAVARNPDGDAIRGERDATDLIGNAFYQEAAWVALPVARLPDEFFELRTRMAGAAELSVPLDVNVGTGRTWQQAAH